MSRCRKLVPSSRERERSEEKKVWPPYLCLELLFSKLFLRVKTWYMRYRIWFFFIFCSLFNEDGTSLFFCRRWLIYPSTHGGVRIKEKKFARGSGRDKSLHVISGCSEAHSPCALAEQVLAIVAQWARARLMGNRERDVCQSERKILQAYSRFLIRSICQPASEEPTTITQTARKGSPGGN